MVELRKRKAPVQPPAPAPEKKTKKEQKPPAEKKQSKKATDTTATTDAPSKEIPNVDDIVSLSGFGGEIETNEGTKTTLEALLDASKSGVVLFTYPKASTPGCTKQVCLFRDSYDDIKSAGLSVYGLSTDSPKANTTFKQKQNLSYPLLCDSKASLIGAIGFKKAPKGTTRGVFCIDKKGKVLLRQAGGPDATVDAVNQLVSAKSSDSDSKTDAVEKALSPSKDEK